MEADNFFDSSCEEEKFNEIGDYFDENYTAKVIRSKRRTPRFAAAI